LACSLREQALQKDQSRLTLGEATMTKWRKIKEARYIQHLEAVAPGSWSGVGFLRGGAPFDWTFDGDPRFVAYARVNGQHYESTEPLTFPQFRSTTPQDVLRNVVNDGVQSSRKALIEEGRHEGHQPGC
jgi:hypothetical protein